MALEVGKSKFKVLADPLWVCRWQLSCCCPHMAPRALDSPSAYEHTDLITRTFSKPNYLSKVAHWGLGLQHRNMG